jgi:hypothetical protein
MEEYVIKQKIQMACIEPRAPEGLIQQVILRAKAVVMGAAAHKQLECAPTGNVAGLVSCALIGQLAAVSELPKDAQPEQLASQLEQQQAFLSAIRGGNVVQRLDSGELLQQITGQKPAMEGVVAEISAPKTEGPVIG